MKLASLWVVAALALVPRAAFAQEEPIRLEFEAGDGCPGRPEFMAQVRARTERVRFVEAPNDVRELTISARPEGDRAVGRLRLGKSSDADRLVTGKTCVDVISALALIAALAIDPAAKSVDAIDVSLAPHPSTDATLQDDGTLVPPAPASRETPPPTPARADTSGAKWSWFGGGGARGEISRGFGSNAITLAGASLHVEAGLAIGDIWRPALRLSAVLSASPTVQPDAAPDVGAATFTLIAARLAACPIEYQLRPSFVVRPCASLELGRLYASAETVPNGAVTDPRTGHIARVAMGQSLQGRVRVAPRIWMELEVGAAEPLLRQNFVFHTPDVRVGSVSAVEIGGALGLGAYFP